jgi:hypothetical protein
MNRREAIAALMALPEAAHVTIARPRPDDVILVECQELLSAEIVARMADTLKRIWPEHRVVICDRGIRLKFVESGSRR